MGGANGSQGLNPFSTSGPNLRGCAGLAPDALVIPVGWCHGRRGQSSVGWLTDPCQDCTTRYNTRKCKLAHQSGIPRVAAPLAWRERTQLDGSDTLGYYICMGWSPAGR